MNGAMTIVDDVYQLLGNGQTRHALDRLRTAGETGDVACMVELGAWYLEGRHVPRDLKSARECFGRAGKMGHVPAEQAFICFQANGIGGAADWSAAVNGLRKLASTDAGAARQLDLIGKMAIDDTGFPIGRPIGEKLSMSPAVWVFRNFASSAECQHLIDAAQPRLEPAVIVDPVSGRLTPHPVRTSESASFPLVSEDLVVIALNRRIAVASGTDYPCGEPLQVLRYRPGQEYRPHLDALPPGGNQRIMTLLLYLNGDYAGGETAFTHTGLKFRGDAGDALLFRNALPGGAPDPMSKHAGLPVTSGEKYIATRWIRSLPVLSG
jgi:prolyl 4-hydroxylase